MLKTTVSFSVDPLTMIKIVALLLLGAVAIQAQFYGMKGGYIPMKHYGGMGHGKWGGGMVHGKWGGHGGSWGKKYGGSWGKKFGGSRGMRFGQGSHGTFYREIIGKKRLFCPIYQIMTRFNCIFNRRDRFTVTSLKMCIHSFVSQRRISRSMF